MRNVVMLPIVLLMIVSCDSNTLPLSDYYEKYPDRYQPVIITYRDNFLQVNDSIIEDFGSFLFSYVAMLPGFEYNLRHCLFALDIDKSTPFHEIDSIFRVFDRKIPLRRIFFLVNRKTDTVGFNFSIPHYSLKLPKQFKSTDTIRVDNLIMLYNDSTILNGKNLTDVQLDRELKEIVCKKEQLYLKIDRKTEYRALIGLLEKYNKQRDHFKRLYSELKFNKDYDLFSKLPKYYYTIRQKVDEEYRSMLIFAESNWYDGKTLLTDKE